MRVLAVASALHALNLTPPAHVRSLSDLRAKIGGIHISTPWFGMFKKLIAISNQTPVKPRAFAIEDWVRSLRLSMRRILYRRHITRVEHFFAAAPFRSVMQRFPEIGEKVVRNYAARTLTSSQRAEVIIEHYRQFERLFGSDLLVRAHTGQCLLCEMSGEYGNLKIYLTEQGPFYRESELRIAICYNENQLINLGLLLTSGAAFGLPGVDETIWVGILKAAIPGEASLDTARHFTKAFDGLRPKTIALMVIQALAQTMNIRSIYAPSNIGHVFAAYYSLKGRIKADYDKFWIESGGTAVGKYTFQLPTTKTQRPLSDYKANKRSQIKRRQKLESDLMDAFRASWQTAAAGHSHSPH